MTVSQPIKGNQMAFTCKVESQAGGSVDIRQDRTYPWLVWIRTISNQDGALLTPEDALKLATEIESVARRVIDRPNS